MSSNLGAVPDAPHVIATAGHVDHGKSSLIVRLTGIDPDRWEEEKRRGLTIDLGFAWTTLPSGREVGFVDVPGHERFLRNMLAGVGPVRLVLFVVAVDEGWKPQSEEHLEILDVLGAHGAVVALTKSDLADPGLIRERSAEVAERISGTSLEDSPIVPCSSSSGDGIEELRSALDAMVATAPAPDDTGRPRISVDRSFTITGAGTVVTGTLRDGVLKVGDEVELYPTGVRARLRSLQTHRRTVDIARPVSRVAANLAATTKEAVERGDVLGRPGQWRPTSSVDVLLLPVRSLGHPVGQRGAYKLYLGAAERDASIRFHDVEELSPGGRALARLRVSRPVVAAPFDRFVLREAGRRETVAGGVVLDPHPLPGRPSVDRLESRRSAGPSELSRLLLEERGAVRASELLPLTGSTQAVVPGAQLIGAWWISDEAHDRLAGKALAGLEAFHRANPMRPGAEIGAVRAWLEDGSLEAALESGLAGELLDHLAASGRIVRTGTTIRLPSHEVSLGTMESVALRLVDAVRAGEPTPPDSSELAAAGFDPVLVDAVCASGRLVRISREVVVSPELAADAETAARRIGAGADGISVSAFRQELATTRKFALPLLAWLDERGVTIRAGDVRRLR